MEEHSGGGGGGDSDGDGDGRLPGRNLLIVIHFLHSRNLLIVIRLNIHFLILPDYLPGSL